MPFGINASYVTMCEFAHKYFAHLLKNTKNTYDTFKMLILRYKRNAFLPNNISNVFAWIGNFPFDQFKGKWSFMKPLLNLFEA